MKQQKLRFFYNFLLIIPFLGIAILQFITRVRAIKEDYSIYNSVFIALMIFIILILFFISKQQNKKHKHSKIRILAGFNTLISFCWFSMCFLMLYSDIAVFKKYWMLSLILLILFTGFFYITSKFGAENRDRLLSSMLFAIEIGFLLVSAFCYLFRPFSFTSGIRYNGPFANPNVFGIFLLTVWCCLITRLDYIISRSAGLKKATPISIMFGMASSFLFVTGARTSFVTIVFISLLWFVIRAFHTIKDGKPLMKYVLYSFAVTIVSFLISFTLLSYLPSIINHPVSFERDRDFTAIKYNDGSTCQASSIFQAKEYEEEPSPLNRIVEALKDRNINELLNGRIEIYKNYIIDVNFNGHRIYGKKINGIYVVNAHNNAIQMAYSYGLLSAVPYIFLCIIGIIFAFRYFITYRDRSRIAAFPLMIIVSFNVATLTECMLIPFQSLLAFCFYICIGELMITYGRKKQA